MKRHLIMLALAAFSAFASCAQAPSLTTAQQAAIDNIMTRTSIRSWEDKAVPDELVDILLRAGMAAPTAVNRQPWHFVVLDQRDDIDRLANGRGGGMVRKAPLAIVVCGDMNLALDGIARDYWVQDASAATENILLAANAVGLGAVWTGVYPIDERVKQVKDALQLTDNLVPLCTILIGYPHEHPTPKDKWDPGKVTHGLK